MLIWLLYEYNKVSGGLPEIERSFIDYLFYENKYLFDKSIFINFIFTDDVLNNEIKFEHNFINIKFKEFNFEKNNKIINDILLMIGLKNIELIIMNEVLYTDIIFLKDNNIKLKYIIHNFEYCVSNKIMNKYLKNLINYSEVFTISEHYKNQLYINFNFFKNKNIKFFEIGLNKYDDKYNLQKRLLFKENKLKRIENFNFPILLNFTSRIDYQKNIAGLIKLLEKEKEKLFCFIYYSDVVKLYNESVKYLKVLSKLKNVKLIYEKDYNVQTELNLINSSDVSYFNSNFEPAGQVQYKSLFCYTICFLPEFILESEFNKIYRISEKELLEILKLNKKEISNYFLNFINNSNYFDCFFNLDNFLNILFEI